MIPFFSVVIPTFNRANKLKETLASVIGQTFSDFEVLVMDDGSTDNTQEVVLSFNDSRIRYEWAQNSGGPATPRNRGINSAKANWICFLDADDIWYSNKLSRVRDAILENPSVVLFCHNEMLSVHSTQRKSLLQYGPFVSNFYKELLIMGNCVSTSAVTVNRSFLDQYSIRFNQGADYVIVEDYDMWLHIAYFGGIFYFIKEVLGEYIIDNDNISSNVEKIRRNHQIVLRKHIFDMQSFCSNKDKLWLQIYTGLLISYSKEDFLKKNLTNAFKNLLRILRVPWGGVLIYLYLRLKKRLTR